MPNPREEGENWFFIIISKRYMIFELYKFRLFKNFSRFLESREEIGFALDFSLILTPSW